MVEDSPKVAVPYLIAGDYVRVFNKEGQSSGFGVVVADQFDGYYIIAAKKDEHIIARVDEVQKVGRVEVLLDLLIKFCIFVIICGFIINILYVLYKFIVGEPVQDNIITADWWNR
jgi:hypothetical protein